MKTYSILFLDVDGTLLTSQMDVSPNTRKLLARLRKKGIPLVLCSARGPGGVEMAQRKADIQGPAVCYGGSLILDESRDILWDSGIAGESAIRFKQFAGQEFPAVTVSSYMYDIWLADRTDDPFIRLLSERNETCAVAGTLESALKSIAHVHKLLCAGEPRDVRHLQLRAREFFPELQLERSGSQFLEAFAKDTSKCGGMEFLCRRWNMDPGQAVAIGDYYVDMEMIRRAGLGIAMGNAPDAVKEAADRVTASNDEEGIWLALKNVRFQPPPEMQKGDSEDEEV